LTWRLKRYACIIPLKAMSEDVRQPTEANRVEMTSKLEESASFILGSGGITPFDRAIATVSLRPGQNQPDKNYDFFLTATFGSQIVKLRAGETVFEVVFEIHEAEILIHPVHTKLDFGAGFHRNNEHASTPIPTETKSMRAATSDRELGANSARINGSVRSEDQISRSFHDLNLNYEHSQLGQVRVGSRKSEEALDGTVVRDYGGWKASPEDLTKLSGVKAELNVREHWVKFRHVHTESKTILGRVFNSVNSSRYKEHPEKKELFSDLLKLLALRNLRSAAGNDVATLDIDAIICQPTTGDVEKSENHHGAAMELSVDESVALKFLQIADGSEEQFLTVLRKDHSRKPTERAFVPHCAVESAFSCWLQLLNDGENNKISDEGSAISRYGRNEVKDLKAAGLLQNSGGKLVALNPFPELELRSSFKAFFARKSTLRLVYDLLVADPEQEPLKIGERVGVNFNKNWRPSSCRSNGHRLRSWAGFTFEETLVVSSNSTVARYLRADKENSKRKGRRSIWDGENLEMAKRLHREGVKIPAAARAMGITSQAIYNKRRQEPEFWNEHFGEAGGFSRRDSN
jgi:hypothetical protein